MNLRRIVITLLAANLLFAGVDYWLYYKLFGQSEAEYKQLHSRRPPKPTMIPEGMRATTLRSSVDSRVAPMSRVDVMLSYRPEGRAEPLTQTILQNVEVLTAGRRIEPDPQGKPEIVNVVTLLLSPEDSQKIILASSLGSIQFALHGADTRDVIGGASPGSSVHYDAPGPRIPRIIKPDVITGNKRTTEKF